MGISEVVEVVAKYVKGQKVRIISLTDDQLEANISNIEKCVSDTGTIVGCHRYGICEPHLPTIESPCIKDQHIYDIRRDKDGEIIRAIPEDALELLV